MKKIILSIALLAFASAVMAEGTEKKPSCAGFVSNGFWSNWEISAGAGVGTAVSNGKNLGKFSERLGFEGNVSATKWLHPVFGLRLQLQGGRFANYDAQYGKQKWPYIFVHTDLMINASNWIGGYREDRAYYLVPFVGFGYMASNFTDKSMMENHSGTHQNFAFTFGLLNKFRICESVDFNIELKSMVAPARVVPTRMDGASVFGVSATAGFTYRFNKRDWQRNTPGYSADQVRAFQQAVADSNTALAAAQAENARLKEELQAATAISIATEPEPKVEPQPVVGAETLEVPFILYDYNSSKLSDKEMTRLELMAEQIKAGPKDRVYTIQGHADKQTGTPKGNKRVSDNRARRVYDFLVSKGVNPNQLNYEGKGDTVEPFGDLQKVNRSATIE